MVGRGALLEALDQRERGRLYACDAQYRLMKSRPRASALSEPERKQSAHNGGGGFSPGAKDAS